MPENVVVVIEEGQQRKRLESRPIVNGIENEQPEDREMDQIEVEQSRERKRSRTDMDIAEPGSRLRKMEIVKGMKNDLEEVVIETKIISKLIENIEEEKVKTLIECFNPAIRDSPDYIKEQMLEYSAKWENSKEIFMGAISYIIHSRKDNDYNEEQMKDMRTDRLSEILIREIENRMPAFCGKCQEWYIVQFDNLPEMHCMWCRVGIHDCEDTYEVSKYPGMKWICKKCEPTFLEHFLPKLDQFSFFQGFSLNKDITNKIINKRKDKTKSNNEEKTKEVIFIDVDEKDSDNQIRNSSDTEGGDNSSKDSNKNGDSKDEAKNDETKKECWFWSNRRC